MSSRRLAEWFILFFSSVQIEVLRSLIHVSSDMHLLVDLTLTCSYIEALKMALQFLSRMGEVIFYQKIL
jgi:hypothetical protein